MAVAEKGAGSGSFGCYLWLLSEGNLRGDLDDGDWWRLLGSTLVGGGYCHWDEGRGGGRVSKVGCHCEGALGLLHLLQSFFRTKKLRSPNLIFLSRVSDLLVVGWCDDIRQ